MFFLEVAFVSLLELLVQLFLRQHERLVLLSVHCRFYLRKHSLQTLLVLLLHSEGPYSQIEFGPLVGGHERPDVGHHLDAHKLQVQNEFFLNEL